jgi:hypothetical protein
VDVPVVRAELRQPEPVARLRGPGRPSVETFSPRNVLHAFRLSGPGEVDAEFAAWLAEAYRVGAQEHLRRPP